MATEALQTADGISLKLSLQRSLRRKKRNALLLVAPLFLFVLFTFLFPIFNMLYNGVDNEIAQNTLPTALPLLAEWDSASGETPSEEVYKAFTIDAQKAAKAKTISKLGKRLNYEKSGFSSLFRKTGRKLRKFDAEKLTTSYKENLIKVDKKWGRVATWELLQRESGRYTKSYLLTAFDLEQKDDQIQWREEESRIYLNLFKRTLWLSFIITILTIVLGYPIAYLLSQLKTR